MLITQRERGAKGNKMKFLPPPKEDNNDTSPPSQAPLHSMTKSQLLLYSPLPPTLHILDPIDNIMMEYFCCQIIYPKVTKITTNRASIRRLALHLRDQTNHSILYGTQVRPKDCTPTTDCK